ncbi:hypothetical protein KUTeg_016536 [Tegillarca granosa]|uniref:Uncharacterized protein n=1 Tax=Tegillarca granosa TaxID=220873 RepID=A0ABQ9EL61_TEGGR|nr:hypothetical protein KUTeg_016536 [Tegillarca granosa]
MKEWIDKMEEVDDDSQCSDISDPESGIDTQSSGFVELSDRTLSEDENASLKSAKLPQQQQQDKNKQPEVKKTIKRRKKRPVNVEVTETVNKNHNNHRSNGAQKGLTSQNMHEFSSFHKLDMSVMSKNNKRLYSWLMANGNIPNPRDEAPSIAPMWDSSQTAISENSIIKAPT